MPLSSLPTEPRYWRATWAVAVPSLRSPVSSITSAPHHGGGGRVLAQPPHPPIVDLLVVPGRLRQEPLQPLGVVLQRAGRGRARTAGAHRRSLAPGGGQTMNRTVEAYPNLNKLPLVLRSLDPV